MIRHFQAATRIHAGISAATDTRDVLERIGARRVVVVVDRGLEEIGLLEDLLSRADVQDLVVQVTRVDVNPAPEPVQEAAMRAREVRADAVLGIGGGSALGAAKAIALLQTNDVPIMHLEGANRAAHRPVPTVAIPTTAGSGSEVSNALVLHERGLSREIVVRGKGYEPVAAILDATLLRGLPWDPLVFAALDALTHALEALWARGRSMFTDACALHAAREIFDTLATAVTGVNDGRNSSGENDVVLQRLLEASSLANLACGNSGLALVHALSSSPRITLAHGMQNGVLLPHVARFNRELLSAPACALVDELPELYSRIGFQPRFVEGTADSAAMLMAAQEHPFRINNGRDASDDQLLALLLEAGAGDLVRA